MSLRRPYDALRGSGDLVALTALSLEPMHGWGISRRVRQISDGALNVAALRTT